VSMVAYAVFAAVAAALLAYMFAALLMPEWF
jgi:hypothetical protein